MNNFKNNPRRHRYRSNNDRNFKKRNGNVHKLNGDFNNNSEFKRKNPGRNNQNAAKLIEKYNDLAREAQSNGDKILSENYLQHADHFARILNSQEQTKVVNLNTNSSEQNSEEKVDQVVTESDDKKINSQKLKLPSGKTLKGKQRNEFEVNKIKIDVLKSELIAGLY